VRTAMTVAAAVLLGSCSRGVRKDATPPLAPDSVEAAVSEAAREDPQAGPALTSAEQIEHALARTTFGARPSDRQRVARIGVAVFIEEQLHPERIDDARALAELARFPVLSRSTAELAQQVAEARERRKAEVAGETMPEP